MLSTLDAAYAEIARLETSRPAPHRRTRHHRPRPRTRRRHHRPAARPSATASTPPRPAATSTSPPALPKYPAVAAALPNPNPRRRHDPDTRTDDARTTGRRTVPMRTVRARTVRAWMVRAGAGVGVLLHPAQAEAIVSALDKVPATVPVDDLRVAERATGRTRPHPRPPRPAQGRPTRPRPPRHRRPRTRRTEGLRPRVAHPEERRQRRRRSPATWPTRTPNCSAPSSTPTPNPTKPSTAPSTPAPATKRQADALTTILTTASAPPPPPPPRTTRHRASRADTAAAAATTGARARQTLADHHRLHPGSRTGTGTGIAGNRQGPGFIPGHGPKPHITVTIDYNDLKAATADKLGHLIYGDALSAATIRRLACDAHILPIVLGSNSQPLDVGTTVRLATGPIRKALITRDKGCVCCGAPPLYCDAHHVKSWIDGGATKITNLVLLCKRCHRDLHAGHWTIHITNGIVDVARPAWATPDPVPRDRYRPPTTTPHPPPATPTTSYHAQPAPDPTTTGAHPQPAHSPAPGHATPTHPGSPPTTPHTSTPGATPPTTPQPSQLRVTHPRHGAAAAARVTPPTPPHRPNPWHTAEVAARLNPWGDTPDERPVRARPRSSATDFDPWGEGSGDRTRGVPTEPAENEPAENEPAENEPAENEPADNRRVSTGVDVWGDALDPIPDADRGSKPRTDTRGAFDPWGDSAELRGAGLRPPSRARAATAPPPRRKPGGRPSSEVVLGHPAREPSVGFASAADSPADSNRLVAGRQLDPADARHADRRASDTAQSRRPRPSRTTSTAGTGPATSPAVTPAARARRGPKWQLDRWSPAGLPLGSGAYSAGAVSARSGLQQRAGIVDHQPSRRPSARSPTPIARPARATTPAIRQGNCEPRQRSGGASGAESRVGGRVPVRRAAHHRRGVDGADPVLGLA